MRRKSVLILVGIIIAFAICFCFLAYRHNRLDYFPQRHLTFEQLPDKIKKAYETIVDTLPNPLEGHETICISLDKKFSVQHIHTGIDNGIISMIKNGFNHHFYINGQHFKLKANKGDPFIFFDKKLYYTETFYIDTENIKKIKYVEIDLSKSLP